MRGERRARNGERRARGAVCRNSRGAPACTSSDTLLDAAALRRTVPEFGLGRARARAQEPCEVVIQRGAALDGIYVKKRRRGTRYMTSERTIHQHTGLPGTPGGCAVLAPAVSDGFIADETFGINSTATLDDRRRASRFSCGKLCTSGAAGDRAHSLHGGHASVAASRAASSRAYTAVGAGARAPSRAGSRSDPGTDEFGTGSDACARGRTCAGRGFDTGTCTGAHSRAGDRSSTRAGACTSDRTRSSSARNRAFGCVVDPGGRSRACSRHSHACACATERDDDDDDRANPRRGARSAAEAGACAHGCRCGRR